MLNPFPDLLTYSMLSPLILRVIAGVIFIDLGILAFRKEKDRWNAFLSLLNIPKPATAVKVLGGIEIVAGSMLVLGLYTQIAALILAILTFIEAYVEYKEPVILRRTIAFYLLLLSITVSLLFSGAGAFAFDLPL